MRELSHIVPGGCHITDTKDDSRSRSWLQLPPATTARGSGSSGMTAFFVSSHIAPNAESLAATRNGTHEGFVAGVGVTVDRE